MERPAHTVQAHLHGEGGSRKFGGLIVVALLHVGIVAGLILGLKNGELVKKLEDIKVAVEHDKTPPKVPPPPPPDLVKPPPPFVPPPEFQIQSEAPAPTIQAAPKAPPAPPPAAAPPAPPTKLEALMRTHTTPPYPTISQRLGEQGTVILRVRLNTNGDVTAAEVATSSGHPRLDQAAVDYVKAHWKWKPPTQNGKAVEAATQVNVVFDLKNAE